jgi:ubiquinone biosynthesis monooxygenase Coq7
MVQAPEVRQALRQLRDAPRACEGAPPAPDLVSVLQAAASSSGANAGALASGVAKALRDLGVDGTVAGLVKVGARTAWDAAARL